MPDDDRPLFEKPLDELLPPDPPKQRFSIKDTSQRVYDLPDAQLVAIARLQKWMLICFLVPLPLMLAVVLIAFAAPRGSGGGAIVAWVSILIGSVILALSVASYVVKIILASRLFQPLTVGLFVFTDAFCAAGAITLLIVNGRATSTLRRNGIRVGLFGARDSDLPKVEKREATMPKLGW